MPVPELGPDIKTRIGQQLRLMYGEVVNQGMPERFAEILRHATSLVVHQTEGRLCACIALVGHFLVQLRLDRVISAVMRQSRLRPFLSAHYSFPRHRPIPSKQVCLILTLILDSILTPTARTTNRFVCCYATPIDAAAPAPPLRSFAVVYTLS